MHPPDSFRVDCPGCGRLLRVPRAAAGRPAHCPHCPANFAIPANPDGTPGQPVLARPKGASIPRLLLGPAIGLLLIGGSGLFVNGSLAVQFRTDPDADLRYARAVTHNVDSIAATSRPERTDDAWDDMPFAALLGSATTLGSRDKLGSVRQDELARAWRPSVIPVNTASLILSLLTTVGAVTMFAGRGYWLAMLGCVAAAVNVNHLCCVPGAIMGAWGILSLARDEARARFGIGVRKVQPTAAA